MADAITKTSVPKRCAVCLANLRVPVGTPKSRRVRCPKCKNTFLAGDALPHKAETETIKRIAPDVAAADVQQAKSSQSSKSLLTVLTAVLLAAVGAVTLAGTRLKGPEFLVLYGITFVVLIAVSWYLRINWLDSESISVAAFVAFEAIGVLRLYLGVLAGMHKFMYLVLMMVAGGVAFFIRAREGGGYGAFGTCGFSNVGSTCGTSCGGGGCGSGCGGGGCGGCGGS